MSDQSCGSSTVWITGVLAYIFARVLYDVVSMCVGACVSADIKYYYDSPEDPPAQPEDIPVEPDYTVSAVILRGDRRVRGRLRSKRIQVLISTGNNFGCTPSDSVRQYSWNITRVPYENRLHVLIRQIRANHPRSNKKLKQLGLRGVIVCAGESTDERADNCVIYGDRYPLYVLDEILRQMWWM